MMTPGHDTERTLTLAQFNELIGGVIASAPSLRNAWVTAETSDLRRSGHCYMELVQKNPETGETIAKARATVWRTTFQRIDADFFMATGQRLESGMKVMVKVTASFHPAYGLSLNINDIDPAYSMGDLVRIRREILERLTNEGVVDLNRQLPWPVPTLRIAVISAEGAAGYGDFMRHLAENPYGLQFVTALFPALMQGLQAPASIISALELIASEEEMWDCVVIIRGGGATSDLASFENYDLAANVAQFPLPVIVGIGHERDVTVLDYVAAMRVKTPTAAAQWLISRGADLLARISDAARAITSYASLTISGLREELAYITSRLPFLPQNLLRTMTERLNSVTIKLMTASAVVLTPRRSQLDSYAVRLKSAIGQSLRHKADKLDSLQKLIDVLSPEATLRRGYSITRINGSALTDPNDVNDGDEVTTTVAGGTLRSRVIKQV